MAALRGAGLPLHRSAGILPAYDVKSPALAKWKKRTNRPRNCATATPFAELTFPPRLFSFFAQRPRRFAPDIRPGIFIVVAQASRL